MAHELKSTIWIRESPSGLDEIYKNIFTQESLHFLEELFNEYDEKLEQLLLKREERKIQIKREKWMPKFNNKYKHLNWQINKLPERLQNRKLDLGDVSPANTYHFIEALYSSVNGIQVDFDDGHCPTWRNTIKSHFNIYQATQGKLNGGPSNISNCPSLLFRPRAFNMIEHNCVINGKEVNGALFDFAMIMYWNGKLLAELGVGPYFYLSKIESPDETELWNSIFLYVQAKLGIKRGTIKACVLIENVLATYCMDDILYHFKEHAIGLNCGIWDYCASIIAKFGDSSDMLLPDRTKYINITKPFLSKYMDLLINTCHRRGAIATSGMAAQYLPSKSDFPAVYAELVEKVLNAKKMEILKGFDGFMVYDFRLIANVNELWSELCKNENQMLKMPNIRSIVPSDIIAIPKAGVTLEGFDHNITVVLLFIYHWLAGIGVFYLNNYVEDSATAEISRWQLWQWLRHSVVLETKEKITLKFLIDELEAITQKYLKNLCETIADRKRLLSSKYLLLEIITTKHAHEYLTTFLNDNHKFRALHNKNDKPYAKL